jgi:hypothetical protein
MEAEPTANESDGALALTARAGCGGRCLASPETRICCEGSCSLLAHLLLSTHPDPRLGAVFARARERARRLRGAATLVLLVAAALLGCARPSDAAGGGRGAARTTASYQLSVKDPTAVKIGETAAATIQVLPRGPYKINLEVPLKLKLRGPAGGVAPGELQLGPKQAAKLTKGELLLRPGFKLVKAGSHAIAGTLRFSVCTEAQCEIKEEAVKFAAVGE